MAKRIFDIISASMAMMMFLPLMLVVAALVRIDSPGGVFFYQPRVGKNGKLFNIIKFRTMFAKQPVNGVKITPINDSRITKVGKFLRYYKLDELPQLWNIIRGDMSVVGPRPQVLEYVNYCGKSKDRILSVRPGLTDIAAIKFRNESAILAAEADPQTAYIEKVLPKKIAYYRMYLQKKSFCFDIYLIFRTIKTIVF